MELQLEESSWHEDAPAACEQLYIGWLVREDVIEWEIGHARMVALK